jgi:hypothetical protein
LNVVEVPVRFQPEPLPVVSLGVSAGLAVVVCVFPFSVTAVNDTVLGGVKVSEPPPQLP